jgi:hypothetical protein
MDDYVWVGWKCCFFFIDSFSFVVLFCPVTFSFPAVEDVHLLSSCVVSSANPIVSPPPMQLIKKYVLSFKAAADTPSSTWERREASGPQPEGQPVRLQREGFGVTDGDGGVQRPWRATSSSSWPRLSFMTNWALGKHRRLKTGNFPADRHFRRRSVLSLCRRRSLGDH